VTRTRLLASLLAVLALVLAGCAGTGGGDRTIRVALDWTPNTNHTGLFVAQAQGWFAEAGLDVEFLPYNSTSPDTLVSAGAAEFGISFHDTFTYAKAAGADTTSVMAVLQHWGSAIAVRADRADITGPADLDGAVYGGFGGPGEAPKMQAVIRAAGGTGDFSTVVLGTSAYEALYAGEVDFTEPFLAWEGIEAELRGEPLKTFAYTDYGFPDAYAVLLIGNSPWLAENPEQARAFVQAAQRGYTLGADDPDRAAQILLDAHPDVLTEPELVRRSQRMLAQRYLRDDAGVVGPQTAQQWAGFSGFLFDTGTLTGPDGAPLAQRPDFDSWWTNKYLAETP
jgi:ABC-type nitrate/sulfonate/bicarbonate transport system substrate-binding protein